YMRCLNGGLLVNYHYTRFGEVLLFLSLKPLDTQGLRIMKFIHLAKKITKDKKNNFDKAKAIYKYTAKTISYDVAKFKNNEFEWDDNALKTLKLKTGVCQDYAYLAGALLRASNIEARVITGKAGTGLLKENHAWIEAKINGKWLTMDPTWGAGFVQNDKFVAKYTDKYFQPNMNEFNKTHLRDKVEY
ncbi:transglutaminase domain-containing protein, partial [Bacillus sporothermodurans]|uniref:transglutaminase domain-containing protein n=1 Tax=Heyndrickxia sporothermodurans TaxID=46224 RepID=UPI00192B96C1